jgi:hypothetical protein
VAERSGDTAFPDARLPQNVTCYSKAPSPTDDRHQSRSAGAIQKGLISLGIFQDILRLPASACRAGLSAEASAKGEALQRRMAWTTQISPEQTHFRNALKYQLINTLRNFYGNFLFKSKANFSKQITEFLNPGPDAVRSR